MVKRWRCTHSLASLGWWRYLSSPSNLPVTLRSAKQRHCRWSWKAKVTGGQRAGAARWSWFVAIECGRRFVFVCVPTTQGGPRTDRALLAVRYRHAYLFLSFSHMRFHFRSNCSIHRAADTQFTHACTAHTRHTRARTRATARHDRSPDQHVASREWLTTAHTAPSSAPSTTAVALTMAFLLREVISRPSAFGIRSRGSVAAMIIALPAVPVVARLRGGRRVAVADERGG